MQVIGQRDTRFHQFKAAYVVAEFAYRKCQESEQGLPEFAIATCNLAFAAEIGYKTILHYCGENKVTHSLVELDREVRKEGISICQEQDLGISTQEMNELLTIVDNNFVEWRYYYEDKDKHGEQKALRTNLLFLWDLLSALDHWLTEHTW